MSKGYDAMEVTARGKCDGVKLEGGGDEDNKRTGRRLRACTRLPCQREGDADMAPSIAAHV